ncbi:MAG: type II toxin-antitoxin system PemK/MazF family toxin [Ruminiclostridium sp.]|nr:type II toxin-antitoxin system PemK/MazF family toxin [Ruminiclostridium sp.]
MEQDRQVRRGEVYFADLSPIVGSEQGGVRPVLVLQNDVGNKNSPTTVVAVITSRKDKNKLPTHIEIKCSGLYRKSTVLLEQLRTIDKSRLINKVGEVNTGTMTRIDKAVLVCLGVGERRHIIK